MNSLSFLENKNTFTILIIGFFISILTGPFLSDSLLIIIGATAMYNYRKLFFFYLKKNLLLSLFGGLLVCLFITSLFAEKPFVSIIYSLAYSRYLIFTFAVFIIFMKNEQILYKLPNLILILIFFIFINVFMQDYFGFDLFGNRPIFDYRLSSFFKEELIMGKITIGLLIIFLATFFYSNKILFNNSILIIFSISLYIILMSGERVALFNYLTVLFVYFFLLLKNNLIKMIFLLISFIFVVSSFLFFNESVKDRLIFTTIKHITSSENSNTSIIPFTVYSNEHEALYNVAIENFKNKPFTGSGVGSFRDFCQNYTNINNNNCSTHPHNNLFELLSESGIFAFSILLFIFIFCVFCSIKYFFYFFKKNDYISQIFISFGCSSFFIPYIPSFSFHYNNHYNVIVYFSFGLFVFLNHKKLN